MTRNGRNQFVVAALTFLMVLMATGVTTAGTRGEEPAAEAGLHATGVTWQAKAEFESAVLRVSGPGDFILLKRFAAGEVLALDLADASGAGFQDGQYVWELSLTPRLSQEVKAQLRGARESEDFTGIEALKLQGKLPEIEPLSGSFRIKNGSVITANRQEASARATGRTQAEPADGSPASDSDNPVATKDQVILDDLIVDGSICAGQDCVNGESFGFDTLRLKENNLRIKFQDTSNSASFPTNDWQLTANDSSNGGKNKFSIDDIDGGRTPFTIEAGAPSHSLYVEDGGRVGFGTSTPVVELHVADGDTPTLRLEQDGSSGFTPQTWDLAGNETNFFIRDVTNGSTLPFRIRPSAPTSSLDISSTGNVGINTSSPDTKLHVLNGDIRVDKKTSGTTDHASMYFERTGVATPSEYVIRANATTGALEIKDVIAATTALKFRSGAANNSIVVAPAVGGEARVGIGDTTPSGTLDVAGTIFLSGAQIHADFVFEPSYDLESIEEHAEFMWANRHLPAVGPGEYDENGLARFELGKSHVGIVEELEKAHIYIEQLNDEIRTIQVDRNSSSVAAIGSEVDALKENNRELAQQNSLLEAEIELLKIKMTEIERSLQQSPAN